MSRKPTQASRIVASFSHPPGIWTVRGGLTGSLFSTLNFGYTDNIFLAEKKAESDFSIQPGFGLGLQLEVSRQSRLRLDIGLGYNFYVNHSELNYLSASILPNSVLDYRFVVGDVMIVVFDRFSAPNDARLRPEIGTGSSGLVNYQRINNAMGNTVSWAINRDLVLSGGYTFLIDRGLNSNYSQLDRNTHLFNASAQQRVNELWSVGAFGTYAITDYSKSIQNDATSWALGPMFALRPSRYIEIAASVGFTSTTFDLAKNPFSVRDTASFEGLTFEAAIRHQINRSMNHSLTASRSAELGLGSNFSEYTSVTYSLSWEIIQRMALSGGFSYLNFKQSGVALTGYTPESGGLFRFFVGASYPLAKRLNATFNFAHHLKDSNLLGRDYSQNYVSIGLMYRF